MQPDEHYDLENPYAPPPEPKPEPAKEPDYVELAALVNQWDQYNRSRKRVLIPLLCVMGLFAVSIFVTICIGPFMGQVAAAVFVIIALHVCLGMYWCVQFYDDRKRDVWKNIQSMLPGSRHSWRYARADMEQARRLLAEVGTVDFTDSNTLAQDVSEQNASVHDVSDTGD